MRKFVKWSIIILAIICTLALSVLGFYVALEYMKAKQIPLDEQALLSPTLSIEVFDSENKPIKEDNQISIKDIKSLIWSNFRTKISSKYDDKFYYELCNDNNSQLLPSVYSSVELLNIPESILKDFDSNNFNIFHHIDSIVTVIIKVVTT